MRSGTLNRYAPFYFRAYPTERVIASGVWHFARQSSRSYINVNCKQKKKWSFTFGTLYWRKIKLKSHKSERFSWLNFIDITLCARCAYRIHLLSIGKFYVYATCIWTRILYEHFSHSHSGIIDSPKSPKISQRNFQNAHAIQEYKMFFGEFPQPTHTHHTMARTRRRRERKIYIFTLT